MPDSRRPCAGQGLRPRGAAVAEPGIPQPGAKAIPISCVLDHRRRTRRGKKRTRASPSDRAHHVDRSPHATALTTRPTLGAPRHRDRSGWMESGERAVEELEELPGHVLPARHARPGRCWRRSCCRRCASRRPGRNGRDPAARRQADAATRALRSLPPKAPWRGAGLVGQDLRRPHLMQRIIREVTGLRGARPTSGRLPDASGSPRARLAPPRGEGPAGRGAGASSSAR
jgi:hypothetical protein